MTHSLTERHWGWLLTVAGFALLLNPFVVGALDVGDPDSYTYEPKEVTFYDNGTYDAERGAPGLDPEVACFERAPSRSCVVERAVHADGGVVYDGLPSGYLRSDYEYVYVWGKGFFEPVGRELANDSVEYGLDSVPRSEALEWVAAESREASAGIREALETGQYRTRDRIDGADELVEHDGDYYVVTATSYRTTTGERRDIVIALQWIAGIGGALLVLRGQRLRVTAGR
ncbi:hypothetical protein I7X12_09205 [Halosimplex litoreum]|uniref:Uncharacterized protein n=1 Tax=Halosimplex litoreum TaxID=1198301 RepID=A0A7U3WAW3_9EURY|nr:hypothetical protein [Halosimplex litoreum]QPV64758.1 hypothetical protein I7X12_09205 [Halosimplex litoreum]